MAAHAKRFSFSKTKRWMSCTASVVLEPQFPDTSNKYAEWGTDAHELAHMKVLLSPVPVKVADFKDQVMPLGNVVDDEMIEMVQGYVDRVNALRGKNDMYVEERVELREELGLPPGVEDGFGTADIIILAPGDDEIIVADLKTGKRPAGRDQLRMYGAAALKKFGLGHDYKRVRMIIDQPKLGVPVEWTETVEEILAFQAEAAKAVKTALIAEANAQNWVGKPDQLGYYAPSDEACEFCKARALCPAAAKKVQDEIGADFETMIVEPGKIVIPGAGDALAQKMAVVDYIESWVRAVRGAVETLLMKGEPVPGFKLVQGRKGNRQWRSKDEAIALFKSFRWKEDQIYDKEVISPATALKQLKGKDKQILRLNEIITQADGKPSVAPASDPRAPLSMEASAEEFDAAPAGGAEFQLDTPEAASLVTETPFPPVDNSDLA